MEEFKGTKGTWELQNTGIRVNGELIIRCCVSKEINIGEARANAQLVVAAPELLEASQVLHHYHLCEQEGIGSAQPTAEEWTQAVEQLGNALSKALGMEDQL